MNLHRLFIFLLALVIAFDCAKQMPPSGGPTDKTPPEVVAISPTAGSTLVPLNTSIMIEFSERVTKKSVENAIFISPWPSEEIFFQWRGKKLKIEFGDSLKPNKTYVLTVGAQTSDLRNNKMRDSFSIAFSTGEKIDSGQIAGTVYGSSGVEGTLVCAYQVKSYHSPDPTEILADYYTQCNEQGGYTLMYVSPGTYRIFAFGDRDRNRKYTRGVDNIGVPNSDTFLSEENLVAKGVDFRLSVEDTVKPTLKSAFSLDNAHVALRFSEEISPFNPTEPNVLFSITVEQNSNEKLNIKSCYQNSIDPSQVHLKTDIQSEIPYVITARKLFDLDGNEIDTAFNSVVFTGKTIGDTIKPKLVAQTIQDSSRNVPLDEFIGFTFSEAMDTNKVARNLTFTSAQGVNVPGTLKWINPADFLFFPDSQLKGLTEYTVFAPVDSITDMAGNALADSLFRVYFTTLNEDTLTAIRGRIIDENEQGKGSFYLSANSGKHTYHIVVDELGDYRLENILPGIYVIDGFRDADGNGVYSFGRVIPFEPAERFVFYPDSVKVRSRWPTEGEDIIFK